MIVFIAILLTVLTFAFVTYPLFRQKSRPTEAVDNQQLRELHSKRDTNYSMLKELEFDFQSGILTEDDYQDLEKRYKRKAISILRDIEGSGKDTGKGARIEEAIEKQVQELRHGKRRFCPQCDQMFPEGDRFCAHCGASLSQEKRID